MRAETLAYVRMDDGTVAQVDEGGTVPEGADASHIDELAALGVFTVPAQAAEADGDAEQTQPDSAGPKLAAGKARRA